MESLTQKQECALSFIKEFASASGVTPTVRETAKKFGVSIGAAQKYFKALIKKGYLKHTPGISRGIDVSHRKPLVSIPLLGRVQAGVPSLAIEDVEEYVHIDEVVVKGGKCFALKVKGDSMINAGIYEDDVVVVRQQASAEHGEIVVAMMEGEATVKKLFRKNGETYLMPANPAYKPIRADNMAILGKVVFMMRNV